MRKEGQRARGNHEAEIVKNSRKARDSPIESRSEKVLNAPKGGQVPVGGILVPTVKDPVG